jgi:hypothetical protein
MVELQKFHRELILIKYPYKRRQVIQRECSSSNSSSSYSNADIYKVLTNITESYRQLLSHSSMIYLNSYTNSEHSLSFREDTTGSA